jgi:hypothetical protein
MTFAINFNHLMLPEAHAMLAHPSGKDKEKGVGFCPPALACPIWLRQLCATQPAVRCVGRFFVQNDDYFTKI